MTSERGRSKKDVEESKNVQIPTWISVSDTDFMFPNMRGGKDEALRTKGMSTSIYWLIIIWSDHQVTSWSVISCSMSCSWCVHTSWSSDNEVIIVISTCIECVNSGGINPPWETSQLSKNIFSHQWFPKGGRWITNMFKKCWIFSNQSIDQWWICLYLTSICPQIWKGCLFLPRMLGVLLVWRSLWL
jgi:hypothetical protein